METRKNEFFSHLIMQAIARNNKQALEFLLNTSPTLSLDCFDSEGKNPLFLAIFYGRNELAILLLKAGANPNIQNDLGWTPLMQARFQHNYAMINILLEGCADPKFKNSKGETIYDIDFGDNFLSTPILLNDTTALNQLIQKKQVKNYRIPIKLAIQFKRYACLEILLKHTPNLDEDNYLEKALLLNDYVSFELLLKAGANPNFKDEFENTLLHTAVLTKKHLFMNALLRYHADVNVPDKFGERPLMMAIKLKDAISIKALADKKPDLMIKNIDGENAISLIQANHVPLRAPLKKTEKKLIAVKKTPTYFSFFNTQTMSLMTGAFCAGLVAYHLVRSKSH